jgi:hypothetical protein
MAAQISRTLFVIGCFLIVCFVVRVLGKDQDETY